MIVELKYASLQLFQSERHDSHLYISPVFKKAALNQDICAAGSISVYCIASAKSMTMTVPEVGLQKIFSGATVECEATRRQCTSSQMG